MENRKRPKTAKYPQAGFLCFAGRKLVPITIGMKISTSQEVFRETQAQCALANRTRRSSFSDRLVFFNKNANL